MLRCRVELAPPRWRSAKCDCREVDHSKDGKLRRQQAGGAGTLIEHRNGTKNFDANIAPSKSGEAHNVLPQVSAPVSLRT
jgi:hypothetical protein